MAYIDDIRDGTEDDLYSRATGQADRSRPASPDVRAPPPDRPPVRDILDLLYRCGAVWTAGGMELCTESLNLM